MKIINNTNRKIVIYVSNPDDEIPGLVKELKIGKSVTVPEQLGSNICIQDKQKMDAETKEYIGHEVTEMTRLIKAKIDNLEKAINLKFDNLKRVIGDYLDLSSSLSIATVKANLKNV